MTVASKIGKNSQRGKLRIGDDWNAIRIIALSQSNARRRRRARQRSRAARLHVRARRG
jgi:hypothetical protein